MRILLINLPHPEPVQRRFRCSYRAPHFLFPPLELLSIGGTLRKAGFDSIRLIDAIALGWDAERTASEARLFKPEVIITMPGFEILGDDIAALETVAKAADAAKILLFGYLATQFPSELIEMAGAAGAIVGEPELAALKAVEYFSGSGGGKSDKSVKWEFPVDNPDDLAPPDYSLIPLSPYGDFLFPRPFAVLQSSRGCPFNCVYCVRPYGRKMAYFSPERVIGDVERLAKDFKVSGLRFEDDTFPLKADRAEAIARGIAPLKIAWSCLSRPDTIDESLAKELARGGCRRVYLGIESASDRLLERLGRGHTAEQGLKAALAVRKAGMEVAGFFLVGIPGETEDDFLKGIELARKARLDYVGVSTLIPYPGTGLFGRDEKEVSFSLSPFSSRFADEALVREGRRREKAFYRKYYYHPMYLPRGARALAGHPVQAFRAAAAVTRHLFRSGGEGKHGDMI